MGLYEFDGKKPEVHPNAYVSPRASVIGSVEIGEDCSIWEYAVLRGDFNRITIGMGTSVQDNCSVHVTPFNPTRLGDYVTVGHNSVIHACEIDDRTAVGMGAVVLTGAKVGKECVIGAGSVVTENSVIPDGSLILGIPGKVKREVSEEMKEAFRIGAELYVELGRRHKESPVGQG
ncbi:MAG: gamma carbonic anhydrase family protein [Candidatus Thorarchaeota archaeon SMTZ1-83]|nr:MAG: gamma carbonic anhydrase family protein [Candidatus Thorarchaeota archaeon SMTZ1-83]